MDETWSDVASFDSNEGGDLPNNKVARLIVRYDLYSLADELKQSWESTGSEHRSLRDLAGFFNQQLLKRRLMDGGQQVLKGEVETLHSLLTDDDVSESDRIRARRRLEQEGIDVETLLDEFVSYQTIRRYLTNHRGATYRPEKKDLVEKTAEDLQRLQGRVQAVTTEWLANLDETNRISLGEFKTTIAINAYCEDCASQYRAEELLEQGGCRCDGDG